MKIKVIETTNTLDYEKVVPNFIYNRFDLYNKPQNFKTVIIDSGNSQKIIEYSIIGSQADLGLWLVDITKAELEHLLLYIKTNHPEIQRVTYKNNRLSYGKAKAHNHFRIEFPQAVEEMESRVSSKSRSKMKKKLNRAQEQYGEMKIEEYDINNITEDIVQHFFRFKYAIRNREYNMTGQEYLDRYNVSHCYVVKFGDTVGALRFSCEQCPVVYGENFAYNPDLKDFSLGRFIFYYHLIRMTEKKHAQLFFAGGDYEYKTHYGSIEETLYDCTIDMKNLDLSHLNPKHSLLKRAVNKLKKILK